MFGRDRHGISVILASCALAFIIAWAVTTGALWVRGMVDPVVTVTVQPEPERTIIPA